MVRGLPLFVLALFPGLAVARPPATTYLLESATAFMAEDTCLHPARVVLMQGERIAAPGPEDQVMPPGGTASL